jgi:MFS transporter, DHA1 family, multidrug resistance protein
VATVSWKKNLYVMFVAEFIVILGFSFIMPFLPLYIQGLGNFTNKEASFWSGISLGISSIALFLSGPIWGVISDRVGRKPMVLRALFGGAIVQTLAAFAPNIYLFVTLRFIQGLFSGTVPAASALVASTSPRDKTPFAMGLLMLGVFLGNTIGPSIGGFLGAVFGFRDSFFIASGLLLIAGLLVFVLVKEDFHRPVKENSLGDVWHLLRSKAIFPLLVTICVIGMSQNVIQPVISLFIKELNPTGSTSTSAGYAFGLLGLAAAISSLVSGRLGKYISLRKVLAFSCLGAALLNLMPIWVTRDTQLIIIVGLLGLFQGGNMTSTSSLIGLSLPVSQQGIAYGLSQSASALGNGLGPIIGGGLGSLLGLRYVFTFASGLFLMASLLVSKYIKGQSAKEVSAAQSR